MTELDKVIGRVVRYLDPRPADVAAGDPFADSVNIPQAELPGRTHELPPRDETVEVAACGEESDLAVEWLEGHGRRAVAAHGWIRGPAVRGRLWEPNAFLMSCVAGLAPGLALDLGCGTGRDAVALAALGWHTVAVDRLPDALDRGRALAERYAPEAKSRIEWAAEDFEAESARLEGPFDLATMLFAYSRPVLWRTMAALPRGASVVVEAFTIAHAEKHGKPGPGRIANPADLVELPEALVKQIEVAWRGDRNTVRFLATKM